VINEGGATCAAFVHFGRVAMIAGSIVVASGILQQRRDLRAALECEGHHVAEAATTHEVLELIRDRSQDLVVIDSRIQADDFYAACRAIRSRSDAGIIVLIRDNRPQCRIDALNAGADDYVGEAFAYGELLARVRAVLRRVRRLDGEQEQLKLHDRAVDLKSHKVCGPGTRVSHLTPKEFLVLKYLVERPNKTVGYRDLAQAVWQRDGDGDLEYVRIVVSQLRRKLETNCAHPRYILTEHSIGYRFRLPAPLDAAHAYESDILAMARLG
jgi:two-component system KDP operon response regulator KdpE